MPSSRSLWQADLQKTLNHLEEQNLLRGLSIPQKKQLDFSSNDYLSLNSSGFLYNILQEYVRECAIKSESIPYVGSTASRLLRGQHPEFIALEDEFARLTGQASALFFNSGYAANTGTLPAILTRHDIVFCDRLCHASLIDGIRLSYARHYYFQHNDLNDLERQIQKRCHNGKSTGKKARLWIVTESIFSMDGDSPDLPVLCELAERYGAQIYLDEAHAIGVRGSDASLYLGAAEEDKEKNKTPPVGVGMGMVAEYKLQDRIAISVFPCGKAPGLIGAFVCGPPNLKKLLVNKARSFIYATALPPFLAVVLQRVLQHIAQPAWQEQRQHLYRLSQELRHRLQKAGFDTGKSTSQIIPLLCGSAKRAIELAQHCQSAGLDIRAIRPPSVPYSKSRLRISLQVRHNSNDIDKVCMVLLKEI